MSHLQLQTPAGRVARDRAHVHRPYAHPTGAQVAATPDGQGVLITIRSERTVAGAAGPKADGAVVDPATAQKPSTAVKFENGKLTLRALKVDIHALIAEIGRQTHFSVAVDDAVNRTVSLSLAGMEPRAAIQSIATAHGLALAESGGVLMLSEGVPTDLATYRLSGTQSFRMQNTQAKEAQGLLPNFLYQYLNVNAEQNAVVVTAPTQMLEKIGRDLTSVDLVAPQIVIEAVAVEFTDTSDRDVSALFSQQRATSVTTSDSALGKLTYSTIGKLPNAFDANPESARRLGKSEGSRPAAARGSQRKERRDLHRGAAVHSGAGERLRRRADPHSGSRRGRQIVGHTADGWQWRDHDPNRTRGFEYHGARHPDRPTRALHPPRRHDRACERRRDHRHRWPDARPGAEIGSEDSRASATFRSSARSSGRRSETKSRPS